MDFRNAAKKKLRLSQRPFHDDEKRKPRNEGPNRRSEVVDRLTGKISKEEANYRHPNERETKETCSECEHYGEAGRPTSMCRRVAGVIEGNDVCDLFVARVEDREDDQGDFTVVH